MPIIIYAAGSLKSVLTEIAPSLEAISQKSIILHFGQQDYYEKKSNKEPLVIYSYQPIKHTVEE